MNDISTVGATSAAVIGTGLMGSALARALTEGGLRVSAWNRSREKAERLTGLGVTVADTVADAAREAEVVIVCVSDFEAVFSLLKTPEATKALAGGTIVNYTSGAAADVRDCAAWATANGIEYIHGAIFVYPKDIGSPEGEIAHSGSAAVYRKNEAVLRALAGKSSYLGEDPACACLLERAMFAFYFGCVFSFYQGSAVLEAEGVDLDLYANAAQKLLPVVGDTLTQSLAMYRSGDYSGTDAHLDVHLAAVRGAYEDAVASGVSSELLAVLFKMMTKGIQMAGGIEHELPIIFNAFRKP